MAVPLLAQLNFLGTSKKDAKGSLFLHGMYVNSTVFTLVLYESV